MAEPFAGAAERVGPDYWVFAGRVSIDRIGHRGGEALFGVRPRMVARYSSTAVGEGAALTAARKLASEIATTTTTSKDDAS